MARRRMLDPEFWLDEEMAKLSAHARLFYMGLWGICDDNYATFPGKIGWLKIQIFPYEEVSIPLLLTELVESGRLLLFEYQSENYYFIKNFFKYQKVEKPSLPKYPKYPGVLPDSSPTSRSEVSEVKEVNKSFLKNSRETLKEQWGTKK